MPQHIYRNIQGWCNFYDLYSRIIDQMPDNFVFAEVGVWKGHSISYFTVEAVNRNKQGTIYAIDHWQGSAEHHNPADPSYEPMLKDNPDGLFEHFKNNIKSIEQYITILRNTSEEAANIISDQSLDAVFVDASHTYEDVMKDLALWKPKVKHNGIFAGHDYDWATVRQAVHDFAQNNNMTVIPTSRSCWILR